MIEGGLRGGGVMVGIIWSTRTLSAVTAGMTYICTSMIISFSKSCIQT